MGHIYLFCPLTLYFFWSGIILEIISDPGPLPEPRRRKVVCYAVQVSVPSPRLPPVEHRLENDVTVLTYKGDRMIINTAHFHKLVSTIIFAICILLDKFACSLLLSVHCSIAIWGCVVSWYYYLLSVHCVSLDVIWIIILST